VNRFSERLTTPDKRHFGRHHGDKLYIGIKRDAGHMTTLLATCDTSIIASTTNSPFACFTPLVILTRHFRTAFVS
jgi:hypothetical protein